MKTNHDTGALLRRAVLFAGLPEDIFATLAGNAHEVRLATGEILFRQGDPADRFYFVCEGLIKLYRLSSDGDEKIIEVMRPGGTFAEAVMFMGTGRFPVNAEALNDARLLGIEHRHYMDILQRSPEACFTLLGDMSRRLHQHVNQIESLALQNATYRLVSYLLDQIPRDIKASPEVLLMTPKTVIAAQLSIQPETLSRILAKLRRKNLIEVEGNHIKVLDAEALRQLVHLPPTD